MTQEDKELLIRYLSMALPYNVYLKLNIFDDTSADCKLTAIDTDGDISVDVPADVAYNIIDAKPYLRPLSSMTEEEEKELHGQMYKAKPYSDGKSYNVYEVIGLDIIYLNSHHFDYLGLIPKGLAIAITEENNPYKK